MIGRTICIASLLALFLNAQLLEAQKRPLLNPPLWVDRDDKSIPEPPERECSELFDRIRNMWLRHIDLGYTALRISNRPALNINAWDEVPDSCWFTNRIGRRAMTPEELLEGPGGAAPAAGPWWVLKLKTEGYTLGFQIRDEAGRRYMLKFDLPESPERNSAAERIGALIMHAAGYNVPYYAIVHFREGDLQIDPDAEFEDPIGRERPMTQADLLEALTRLASRPDGSFRAIASLFIDGIPKGYFPYRGVRKDDPNDLIPHELRRELRGFRVIASWFNHVDVKEVNTYDAYVTKDGRSFLKHFFLDFGSTMGSGNFVNGPCRVGYEYIFDGSAMGKSLVTLGAWDRPWEAACVIDYPEVGWFEGDLFHPATWKANYPNLAFSEMDKSDAYWGAKIVTAFTDELIRTLAEAGAYTRPEVTEYVAETFRKRRDKIGEYWFDVVAPLEEFVLETGGNRWLLRFRDLGVERGYADGQKRSYYFEMSDAALTKRLGTEISREVGKVEFPRPDLNPISADRFGRRALAVLDLHANQHDGGLALPVRVIIGYEEGNPKPQVLGWTHAPRK